MAPDVSSRPDQPSLGGTFRGCINQAISAAANSSPGSYDEVVAEKACAVPFVKQLDTLRAPEPESSAIKSYRGDLQDWINGSYDLVMTLDG